ncbi:hypothetical protein DRW07_15280 [Alteromonas sediminis]|uniref:Uncharacterized protein n=1 Tax=Alteromonas sediminis TaxID=2259342 RepID=A0A3N5Y5E6_9ALTE|nr:hypothetical protein [Alteromonas sediminis]RPJ65469.1 hypothetical protein DRW07_15280 [Alteromonas sediminis]
MSEQRLQDALAALPSEKSPQRDLWRGIELALENPGQAKNDAPVSEVSKNKAPVWLASAASFALVATLGWFGLQEKAGSDLSIQSAALVESLSQQQQNQVNAMLVRFEGQDPASDNWQEQMKELDDAATAIKVALEEDPANGALLQMLQHVYQQQIALIERVHAPKWQQI